MNRGNNMPKLPLFDDVTTPIRVTLQQSECWAAAITKDNPTGRVYEGEEGELQEHELGTVVVFDRIKPRDRCVFRVGESFERLFTVLPNGERGAHGEGIAEG